MLDIPHQVLDVCERLGKYNYKSYIVGECVRDLIAGGAPIDFDIVTEADIDSIVEIFRNYRTINDKILLGEILVLVQGMVISVSPYREAVDENGLPIYGKTLRSDLERRNFTINAIAYGIGQGIVDPFKAAECLEGEIHTIKATFVSEYKEIDGKNVVVSTVTSIEREPINILKALSYLATGEYRIFEGTKALILDNVELLQTIPQDVLLDELTKVILGKRISDVMQEYEKVFTTIMPELLPLIGFKQYSKYQSYDMWEHTYKSVGYSTPDVNIRYALLFHALGKPYCYGASSKNYVTYFGHCECGRIIASQIMERLGFEKELQENVEFLISHHDMDIPDDFTIIRFLITKISICDLKRILLLKYANTKAKSLESETIANAFKQLAEKLHTFNL